MTTTDKKKWRKSFWFRLQSLRQFSLYGSHNHTVMILSIEKNFYETENESDSLIWYKQATVKHHHITSSVDAGNSLFRSHSSTHCGLACECASAASTTTTVWDAIRGIRICNKLQFKCWAIECKSCDKSEENALFSFHRVFSCSASTLSHLFFSLHSLSSIHWTMWNKNYIIFIEIEEIRKKYTWHEMKSVRGRRGGNRLRRFVCLRYGIPEKGDRRVRFVVFLLSLSETSFQRRIKEDDRSSCRTGRERERTTLMR